MLSSKPRWRKESYSPLASGGVLAEPHDVDEKQVTRQKTFNTRLLVFAAYRSVFNRRPATARAPEKATLLKETLLAVIIVQLELRLLRMRLVAPVTGDNL